ncbi:CZB domain-containing protein, partial [Aduncisulcus paluster]
GFGKWYYSEERKKAEELVPEIKPLLAKIESHHNKLHKSAIAIEEKYENQLMDPDSRSITVQADPHKCGLGKWLYSSRVKGMGRAHPEFGALLEKVYEPHTKLHDTVKVLNSYLARGDREGAQKYFSANVEKYAADTLSRVEGLIQWHEGETKLL